jgi:hypothetical protein
MRAKFDPAQADKRWMLYAVLVALVAWLALWGLVHLPLTDSSQAIFFALLFVAVTSTVMPPIAYLNIRFGRCPAERTYQARFVRQSIWLGLFCVVTGWLQARRILTTTLAVIVIAVFFLTETFLLTRESPPRKT